MTQDQLLQSQSVTSRQGSIGEQFALAYERKRLPEFLHGKIVHFEEHEIALGYDILSFETRTSILPDRYIEVKTFRGHPHFFWSENEIATARKYGEHYYLYLIDIDCINEPNYEPQIISNPAVLFNEDRPTEEMEHSNTHNAKNASNGHTWTFQPVQYVFSLNAEAHIPQDWNTSTILLGCYNTDEHLRWIIEHNLYNVRTGKNSPGAVSHSDPQVYIKPHISYYIAYPILGYTCYTSWIHTPTKSPKPKCEL